MGEDFNLWMASQDVKRGHMHQGTNYRYQPWQSIETNLTTKLPKTPFYDNVAIAAFLGGLDAIVTLPLGGETSAADAGYGRNGTLKRVLAINMQQYNASVWNSEFLSNYTRPKESVTFDVGCGGTVRRLMANGSDAITALRSISGANVFSVYQELPNGKPVLLHNITIGEIVLSWDVKVTVQVPYSSVAIVDLGC
ncbi:hypothetical protein VTL71DRAFT_9922 [Oculimacula yallundae]|uniref:Beta-glucuronidase C-terminal domain-containing protein n=1 Tax=Oculimacula yallundae TaxID=86028 RepID=A0ABR4BQY1_9HELO